MSEFTDQGRRWTVWVYVQRGTGEHQVCIVAVPADGPGRHPNSPGCVTVRPAGPPGQKLDTLTVLGGPTPGGGPLHGLLLFVTAPAMSQLDVYALGGTPVAVRELGRTDDLALFLVDLGVSYNGFGVRARGTASIVFESGIS